MSEAAAIIAAAASAVFRSLIMPYPIFADYALNYHVHYDMIDGSAPASRCQADIDPEVHHDDRKLDQSFQRALIGRNFDVNAQITTEIVCGRISVQARCVTQMAGLRVADYSSSGRLR
jgi:hypothetical protein